MNILLLVKRFQFGGAENHVCELANALAENGHRVWLLSDTGSQVGRLHPMIQYRVVRFTDLKLAFHLYSLVRLVRKERIEIIHAHQRFPIFLGTLAAKWCKIPLVATVHGSSITDLKTGFVRKSVDRVITIRESCHARLKETFTLGSKVVLIPNGINLPASSVTRKVEHQGFSLFYISRLDQHHAQLLKFILADVWPQMVRKYPDSILHIVGDGTGLNQIKQFWQAKKFNPYRETVRFEGYCRDVPVLYPMADLVMGVGRVAIESLVYGVPLLSVKYNHLGPIITQSNFKAMQFANFVDLNATAPDGKNMLNKLIDFLANREFYENQTRILQQIVQQEYNMSLVVKRIVGVYREVI